MSMRYAGRRVVQALPTIAGILVLSFALIHFAPGDPILALAGEHGDAEYYEFMRERFALDEPFPIQLGTYLKRVATGDLGRSFTHGRPAIELVAERLPATLLLSASALLMAMVAGLLLGLRGATTSGSVEDLSVRMAILGLDATPVFLLGQIAVLTLGLQLGLFPVQGMSTAGGGGAGWAGLLDLLHHLALPALVLAAQQTALIARLTRTEVRAALATAHVRTARAKGIANWRVTVRHALPQAFLPILTVIGHRVGYLLGGAVVVEVVFAWPGLGRLLVQAIQVRDMPVLLAMFLVVAVTVVLANLLTDLLYVRLDPRVRHR